MQFTVTINQVKALEWGLNAQQALLFAFVYSAPSWAAPVEQDGATFYALSKAKIIDELPLLTDKADTAYRMLKALAAAGLIVLSSTSSITLFRLTEKAQEWNRKRDGSEKYPTSKAAKKVGKKSDIKQEDGRKKIRSDSEKNPSKVGKKSDAGSEKSPTNQDTSNQDTNQDTSQVCAAVPAAPVERAELVLVSERQEPRCEIPNDMPGPKDQSCKTFKAWANYAMAFRKRYATWPVWNAKVAGQLGQLVDRLGRDEAPKVAAFYLCVNDRKLISSMHSVGHLLQDAESYRTQWFTGRQINSTTAAQIEKTQSNLSAAEQALAEQRARRLANVNA